MKLLFEKSTALSHNEVAFEKITLYALSKLLFQETLPTSAREDSNNKTVVLPRGKMGKTERPSHVSYNVINKTEKLFVLRNRYVLPHILLYW